MMRKLLPATLVLLLLSGAAWAASTNFNVTINIRQAITITKISDLDFGTVEAGSTTYTVAAATSGHNAGASATAATFDVDGTDGAAATVQVSSPVTVTGLNLGGTGSVALSLSATNITFPSGTPERVYVGGSIDVTGLAADDYSGSSTITVLYQ